jgi:deoxyribodipyrimidine photo-lyase
LPQPLRYVLGPVMIPMERLDRLLAPHPRTNAVRAGQPDPDGRCVFYWMQRAQRGVDNPALNVAIIAGNLLGLPVLAVFGLTADYPGGQRRHFRFLVDGLRDTEADLERRGVALAIGLGRPDEVVANLADQLRPALVIGDENPVRVGGLWRAGLASRLQIPFYLIDSDVVVPMSLFPKEEYAARTIRPKIHRVWDSYLKPLPAPSARVPWSGPRPRTERNEPEVLLHKLKIQGVAEVVGYKGGTKEAMVRLERFIEDRLPRYATERNEPTPYMTSELSAHLHFGHISPLTIALAVQASGAPPESIDVYLEELIVRRELAINFVARNPHYDTLSGCPDWARKTLMKHAADTRPILYTARQLEEAETHDPLWNAAQKEMVSSGRMHNYLRMYWAKKILEWSPDPETAYAIALDLNDRYEMDGRDPNGYTGVAWAIGGKHDRPWPERPIFGTIRFMSYDGARKKLDSERYIAWVRELVKSGSPGRIGSSGEPA